MTRSVFVINAGSSSLKYQLVDVDSGEALASGLIERIGETTGEAKHAAPVIETVVERRMISDHEHAFGWLLRQFDAHGPSLDGAHLLGVGHRVVQGGARFDRAVRIDEDVQQQIEDLAPLAPLHNPANLQGINAAQVAFPDVPHVAVFDTAFHQTIPAAAYTFNKPTKLTDASTNTNPMAGEEGFTGTDGGRIGGSWGTSQVDLAKQVGVQVGLHDPQFGHRVGHGGGGGEGDDAGPVGAAQGPELGVEFVACAHLPHQP